MANSKKSIANSTLVLRIFTLIILAASVVVMATDNFKLSDGSKTSFKDIIAYRGITKTVTGARSGSPMVADGGGGNTNR
ncbi:unnamed protein product [Camellia sinensis]